MSSLTIFTDRIGKRRFHWRKSQTFMGASAIPTSYVARIFLVNKHRGHGNLSEKSTRKSFVYSWRATKQVRLPRCATARPPKYTLLSDMPAKHLHATTNVQN